MKCHRCGSLMVVEKFYDICESFFGWRCVLCGEIVDRLILENRNRNKLRESAMASIQDRTELDRAY